ncbi:MAG TPA: FkbM family methyltransferase [Terriglobales bacterium]
MAAACGVARVLHPLRGPVTWATQHGILPGHIRAILPERWMLEPFTIYGPDGPCRWVPTEFDSVGHRIFWSGLRGWEAETLPVMLQHLRAARCFVDVGANCGIYTVLGCRANPALQVLAAEPVASVFAALVRNVAENRIGHRVTTLNIALGATSGRVGFHEAEDATMGSLAVEGYLGRKGRVIEVSSRTLDEVVRDGRLSPDFLKIDVEGFTHAVLQGAAAVLHRFHPRMVLEANPGDPAEAVTEILARHGYRFRLIRRRGLEIRPAIVPDREFRNWLCAVDS